MPLAHGGCWGRLEGLWGFGACTADQGWVCLESSWHMETHMAWGRVKTSWTQESKWQERKKMNGQYFYSGLFGIRMKMCIIPFPLLKHPPFCITYDSCSCKKYRDCGVGSGGTLCCYLLSQQLRIIHGMIQWTNITSRLSFEQHKVKARTAALTFPYPQRQTNH